MEVYKEEKIKVKRCKKEVQEQFGRKMNQEVNGNKKCFWIEVCKTSGGKVENYSRIKNGKMKLALEEIKV